MTLAANAHPDKPLVHINDLTFSYAQVDELSGRLATSLLGLGLQRGDKVAVQLPNVPHFLFTYFGILKAGLVMVPLNPLLKAHEVAYHLDNSDAKVLVTFELFADEAYRGGQQISAGGGAEVHKYRDNIPRRDTRLKDPTTSDNV